MLLKVPSLALSALCLSGASFAVADSAADIPNDTPVAQLLSTANAQLAQGNARDALQYFDLAIKKDPTNYLTIFKRGAAYLSLGRSVQATRDFDQVLVLKPGFEGALTQRAKIHARNAAWQAAREDYAAAGRQGSQAYLDLEEAEGAAKLSSDAENAGDWESCVNQAGTAILVAGANAEIRQRRARCRFEKGEIQEGISDLSHLLQINSALVEPRLQIAAMSFFSLGETDKGVAAVAKCLQIDQDNKACLKLRRTLKSIERTLKKIQTAEEKRQLATVTKLLVPGAEPGLLKEIKDEDRAAREKGYINAHASEGLYQGLVEKVCESYSELNNFKKAQSYCDEALSFNPTCLPALINQARRQIEAEEFEAALQTLNKAKEAHGMTHKIQEMMNQAQMLLRKSKQKDYYKVLGVSRDADEREIKKAFRKLTIQYHPDKALKNGIDADTAQKKMATINEAYEVLSNPELKARFDQGDDPNDPHSGHQQGFHGNPFQQGPGGPQFMFRQGGGGGGHQGGFKFQQGAGGGFEFPGGFPF